MKHKKEDPVSDNEKTVDLGLESELETDFDDALAAADFEKGLAADAAASTQAGNKLLLCAQHLRGWIEEEYAGEVQQCYPEHCALCAVEGSDPAVGKMVCGPRMTKVDLSSFEKMAQKQTAASSLSSLREVESSLREVCALLTRARILIERHVPHIPRRCTDHCDFVKQIDTALDRAKGETS